MIVIDDARTAELYEQWRHVHATTERAVAEPLARDCIRRLAAEPGGGAAHIWVAGLAELTAYLACRPEPGIARAAADALAAAAAALGERECGHGTHPYEEDLTRVGGPTGWYLIGEHPEVPRGEADLCPRNVAGVARFAADVIAPFSVAGIPAAVSEDHEQDVKDLLDFLNDYPYGDPASTIESNAGAPPADCTRGVLAGYVITQHVSTPYVYYRIGVRPVFDAMIEGLGQALEMLDATGAQCPHEAGEHPDLEEIYYETEAEIACHVRTPGGRAYLVENALDEGEGPLWVCPGFLRELAEDALGQLRPRYAELFGRRDTSGLDATFVRSDGRLDIDALTRVVVAADEYSASGEAGENAGLWAARRHASATDPHERLLLLHLALWCASVFDLPYGVGREVRALLRSVEQEPLDHDCPHGDGHPDSGLRDNAYRRAEMKPHLDYLYAPGEFTAPEDASPADAWACPKLLAAWAQGPIEEMDERYEQMDEEDGDDASVLR
ncbi:hypothetical protein H9Y04_11080 [Streptomyces sp. TRM66268-LWL]|uniref:DUF4272 domain-containing protein n=1 Tax=Streptomyces polyasparticus TaxID=2767826 RepID=A0ABR7SEV3_9ACTN|nr:hypothetical protein [Streptomyces polyasparticus]MBC9713112.1 hypothetical protein [Streptomyces polyasparticus]